MFVSSCVRLTGVVVDTAVVFVLIVFGRKLVSPEQAKNRGNHRQELSELNQSGTTLLTCRSLSKITERQEGSMKCRRRWTL